MTIFKSRSALELLAGAALLVAPADAEAYEEARQSYSLQAQDLGDALKGVAARAGLELYASSEDLVGRRSPPLNGTFTPREAIDALLRATLLSAEFDGRSVIIRRQRSSQTSADVTDDAAIVVTGSRIEGAPPPAPVITITGDDIRDAGQADLGEVARSLPQNFGGGQNPGIGSGQGTGNENVNVNGASTFNLRGVGPNATLTLLNGNRFSYSGTQSVIDVSAIPVAAVERVEIVADGASAIYGADAVAGVVNIKLRKDYEGVTTSARLGGSTDGGNFQQQYNLLGGAKWSGGGFVATYDYFDNSAIYARDRTYSESSNPASTFYPQLKRHSVLLSGHQEVAHSVKLSGDLIYKRGNTSSVRALFVDRPVTTRGFLATTKFVTLGVAPTFEADLGGSWNARITGLYGTDKTNALTDNYTNDVATQAVRTYNNRNLAIEAGIEGPLFALPAGDARLAAGGGWRRNRIGVELGGRRFSAARANSFAYGEIFIPLASPSQRLGFAHRASLTAALRWEDYSDSGSIVTPKLGFVYAPVPELSLGISWGRSFKMPTLIQQYTGYTALLLPVTGYGNLFPPGSTYLYIGGPNPEVGPERSENITLSATFRPSPRLEIVTSFFRIDYRDRVAPPFASPLGALTNPLYADLVSFDPAADALDAAISGANAPLVNATGGPYDPARVIALLDGRDRNIAVQQYQGADLSLRYRAPMAGGRSLTLAASATWIDSWQRLLPGLPATNLAGTIFNSPHFKARGGATFGDERFSLSGFVSFTGGVTDRRRPVPLKISSMATLDLTGRIKIGTLAEVSLSALNILNAKPERTTVAAAGDTPFDTTNYSAVGRFLGITIRRDW
ncbi:TonB-dependent receptor [Sphingopyxis sp.]|uniref:TonB-dependent receptor n=1 Tax=Sphingopyxis sp. TaxID=1908224 RepID=UPI002D775DD8|nr:TonB-dependent receptor [Sphingopyxis sp.]HET6523518.1 TonB-dependent receptor [Sphingopyxis sp.]